MLSIADAVNKTKIRVYLSHSDLTRTLITKSILPSAWIQDLPPLATLL